MSSLPPHHHTSLSDAECCPQRSALWHQERRIRVCASDVPALLGCSPYNKAADVLAEKLQPQLGSSTTPAQQHGIDSEDIAIEAFLDSDVAAELDVVSWSKTGLYVTGFLGASPDAILQCADGSRKLLEGKCHARDPKELPDDVNLQVWWDRSQAGGG